MEAILGIDLGGTNIKAALVSRDRSILGKCSVPTDAANGPDAVIAAMVRAGERLLNECSLRKDQVLAAGVGAPGPMNWQTGIVYSPPNLPGWKDVPLAESMTERLGIETFVDNDANVACFGEYWLGEGQGTENMCMLTLGTGVGGGIVVFGKLLRGIDGTAGEIGHMTVMRDGRQCNCGAKGCLETYGSVTGLVRTAREGLESGEASVLRDMVKGDLSAITGKMISDGAIQGDAYCQWVFRETGSWIGTAVADLINLLNPEKIIIGGGMIGAGGILMDAIQETAKSTAFDVPAKRAQIVVAGLGLDAGVIGAAGTALERYESQQG